MSVVAVQRSHSSILSKVNERKQHECEIKWLWSEFMS